MTSYTAVIVAIYVEQRLIVHLQTSFVIVQCYLASQYRYEPYTG